MNHKCPYCHKEIEIQVFKPEEYYQPEPKSRPIIIMNHPETMVSNLGTYQESADDNGLLKLLPKENNLSDYLKNLNQSTNKIAYLVYAFKRLHDYYINDEQDESKDAFSFMGKIWKNANKDYGYLMKVIWDTSSISIAGSHLTYINKTIIERRKRENQVSITRAVSKSPEYK